MFVADRKYAGIIAVTGKRETDKGANRVSSGRDWKHKPVRAGIMRCAVYLATEFEVESRS